MKNIVDDFFCKSADKKSVLCVGLDPDISKIPESFKNKYNDDLTIVKNYIFEVLNSVKDHCVAVKPNSAFFENLGYEGVKLMREVAELAKKLNLFVILDAKRSDIGNTAKFYAESYLYHNSPYDFLTVVPYFGADGIDPFLEVATKNNKGLFVVVKSSNKNAGEFQDLAVGDSLFHEEVARSVARWGSNSIGKENFSNLGAVVGLTHPDDIRLLRHDMPNQLFLIPGLGAQGGKITDLKGAFYDNKRGGIVSSTREIIYPEIKEKENIFDVIGAVAKNTNQEIWNNI